MIRIKISTKQSYTCKGPTQGTHKLKRAFRQVIDCRSKDAQSNTEATTDIRTPELTRPRRMIIASSPGTACPRASKESEQNMHVVRGGAAQFRAQIHHCRFWKEAIPTTGDWARTQRLRLPTGRAGTHSHIGTRGFVDPTFAQSEISALVRKPSKKAREKFEGTHHEIIGNGKGQCGARQAEPEPGLSLRLARVPAASFGSSEMIFPQLTRSWAAGVVCSRPDWELSPNNCKQASPHGASQHVSKPCAGAEQNCGRA